MTLLKSKLLLLRNTVNAEMCFNWCCLDDFHKGLKGMSSMYTVPYVPLIPHPIFSFLITVILKYLVAPQRRRSLLKTGKQKYTPLLERTNVQGTMSKMRS